MFAALNIDRNNITSAVSDNMLDDLGLTKSDYVRYFSLYAAPGILIRQQRLGVNQV